MNTKIRELLIKRGMDEKLSDNDAHKWAKDNWGKLPEDEGQRETAVAEWNEIHKLNVSNRSEVLPKPEFTIGISEEDAKRREQEAVEKAVKETEEKALVEQERVAWINDTCREKGYDDETRDDLIKRKVSKANAALELLKKERAPGVALGVIEFTGPGEEEKFRAAALDGLTMRCAQGSGVGLADDFKPAPGANNFRNRSLLDIAKDCLQRSGHETRGISDRELWRRAFDVPRMSYRASDGPAFLSTGNFPEIFLDAQNKTLGRSYDNAVHATTYQIWARQGESVKDFKEISRVRLGEIGNVPEVPENDEYPEASFGDAREFYKVKKHGHIVSLTWESVVNDDLSAFNRVVGLQGSAIRRTINQTVYQVLFDNPTMNEDSVALFHTSSHGANLVTTALSETSLGVAFVAMMRQTGQDSATILNISPKWVIVPATGSTAALKLLRSLSVDATANATNPNLQNLYGPAGPRGLELIVEPLIDGNDTSSWYLAADTSLIDTVEYTFLQGEETPVLDQETGFTNDTIKYKIRQTWGTAPIDYRGLYKSTG